MESAYQILTFNVRRAGSDDGENGWNNRRKMVFAWLETKKPDIIGFQELMPEVRAELEEALTDYRFVGCARSEKLDDEACCIAYRKERFDCIEEKTFWLGEDPYLPGSRLKSGGYWMRICTEAQLRDKNSGSRFRMYNTHLSNDSEQARVDGLEIIFHMMRKDSSEKKLPALLTGDFNATPEGRELQYARDNIPFRMADLSQLVGVEKNFTYHGFFRDPVQKIDYIFASPEFSRKSIRLGTDCKDGIYLSDHYPVLAEIKLNSPENDGSKLKNSSAISDCTDNAHI